MRRILFSLTLVALVASVASANTYVWWELESSNCGAVATQQGSGKALLIEKPLIAPAGFYDFTLVMKMTNDAPQNTSTGQGMMAHRTSLYKPATDAAVWTSPADGTGDGTIGNLDPLGWSTVASGATYINQGQAIFKNYGRTTASNSLAFDAADGTLSWVKFVLRIPVASELLNDVHNYYQTVGAQTFSLKPATTPGRAVFFGANASVAGNSNTLDTWAVASAMQPVITIKATPEPATLALLGLGLLGLIRRR